MQSPNLNSAEQINALTAALSQNALIELGDLLSSLGVSVAEAAWRGSHGGCRLHLLQCKATLKTAAECLKRWEACDNANAASCNGEAAA